MQTYAISKPSTAQQATPRTGIQYGHVQTHYSHTHTRPNIEWNIIHLPPSIEMHSQQCIYGCWLHTVHDCCVCAFMLSKTHTRVRKQTIGNTVRMPSVISNYFSPVVFRLEIYNNNKNPKRHRNWTIFAVNKRHSYEYKPHPRMRQKSGTEGGGSTCTFNDSTHTKKKMG